MKYFQHSIVALALAAIPSLMHAQELGNIARLLEALGNLVSIATPIIVGLAVLVFFWGLVKYIFSAGNEEAKDQGKRIMIGGIIAIFVMVAIFGIVEFIANAFDVRTGGTIDVPEVL